MTLARPAREHAAPRSRRPLQRPVLRMDDVEALRALATRFGPGTDGPKVAALAACASRLPADARVLVAFHDVLLFLEAHPSTDDLLASTRRVLREVARIALALGQDGSERQRARLADSGLPGSEITAAFSHTIAAWLAQRHAACAEITGFGDDGAPLADTLALCLPRIEAEMLAAAGDPLQLLDEAKGATGARLRWLLRTLRRAGGTPALEAHLFESLQPLLTIRPGRSSLSRTRARAPVASPFLHTRPLVRHLEDPVAIIREPLPGPESLGAAARTRLIETARAALAMLARETDPVTWPSPGGVTLYEFGRGAAVALFPMHPSRRFALDSHTGYLMLRNGVPVGYGGAWPFLATART
ncbi:MAG TPA: hypothetical protein VF196_02615, partial [Casimicrobiaceae bacterium]